MPIFFRLLDEQGGARLIRQKFAADLIKKVEAVNRIYSIFFRPGSQMEIFSKKFFFGEKGF